MFRNVDIGCNIFIYIYYLYQVISMLFHTRYSFFVIIQSIKKKYIFMNQLLQGIINCCQSLESSNGKSCEEKYSSVRLFRKDCIRQSVSYSWKYKSVDEYFCDPVWRSDTKINVSNGYPWQNIFKIIQVRSTDSFDVFVIVSYTSFDSEFRILVIGKYLEKIKSLTCKYNSKT